MPEAEKAVSLIHGPKSRGLPGVFRFRSDSVCSYYLFREITCDIGGRGWEVWRLTASEPYHVRTGYVGSNLSCSCAGFASNGLCRHVLAMQNLVHSGCVGHVTDPVIEDLPTMEPVKELTVEF